MENKLTDFEAIMPESKLLDEEMNALRGGIGGNIITIKCDAGQLSDGTLCAVGQHSYASGSSNAQKEIAGPNDEKIGNGN